MKMFDNFFLVKQNHLVQSLCKYLPPLFIFIFIFIFNFPSLGIKLLILDDLANYSEAVHDIFEASRMHRSFTNTLINHFFVNLMAIDPFLSRLLILVGVMIPFSIILYHILFKYYNLPQSVAFFAVIFPQILPGQVFIPFFVVGSYNTWGLFFYFVSLLTAIFFIKKQNISFLLFFTLFYFFSIDVTINIFLAIPFALFLLYFKKINFKTFVIFAIIFIISLIKVFLIFWKPWATTTVNKMSPEIYIDRLINLFKWTVPFFNNYNSDIIIFFYLFVIFCALLYSIFFSDKEFFPIIESPNYITQKYRPFFWLFLGAIWFLSASLLFAFSKYYSSRYVYPAGFAFNFLLIFSIYLIISNGFLAKYKIFIVLMLILTVSVGIQRVREIRRILLPAESVSIFIQKSLSRYDFPRDSQIVIVGSSTGKLLTGEYWVWSSGFLQFVTGRPDISGIVGKEAYLYDPFDIKKRGYDYKMNGLDISQPIFLFRLTNNDFIQLEYFLRFSVDDDKLIWMIYHLDQNSGDVDLLNEGYSLDDYNLYLDNLKDENISIADILWAK